MKLKLPWLRAQSCTVPAECVLIPGTANLYTHPKLPGVLLRRLATAESSIAANGAVFFVKNTGQAHYGYSAVAGEFIGYAGEMWARVLRGEIDVALYLNPRPASMVPSGTIVVGGEIAGISVHTATQVKSYQVDGYEEQPLIPMVACAAQGASASYNYAAGLGATPFTLMEIVSSADDGVFTSTAGTSCELSQSAGPSATAHGYLATRVTLPPLHELIRRNAVPLVADYPSELQGIASELLPKFLEGWANPSPTLAFWLDVSDGVFGMPRYVPKDSGLGMQAILMPPSDSRPIGPAPMVANGASSVWDGVSGKTYTLAAWPGAVKIRAGATAPVIHATHMTRTTLALSGMVDVIDVNMLHRGLSPHDTGVVEDKTKLNDLPAVIKAGMFVPRVSPNWLTTVGTGTVEARLADSEIQLAGDNSLNYPLQFEKQVALSTGRNGNVGNLLAHMIAFVDSFTDAVVAEARSSGT